MYESDSDSVFSGNESGGDSSGDDYGNAYGDYYGFDSNENRFEYADIERTGYGTTEAVLEGVKIFKTPDERVMQNVAMEYRSNIYNSFDRIEIDTANLTLKNEIPAEKRVTLNAKILAPTLLFYVRYPVISSKNISDFLRITGNLGVTKSSTDILDFIRYLRMFSGIKIQKP